MARVLKLRDAVLFLVVPALALFIAGRQLYLSSNYGLSTWKGGGMGMFASADLLARYVRLFIELPDRRRMIIKELTPQQVTLVKIAEIYPSDENFNRLAESLKRTKFSASREPSQAYRFDETGQLLGPTNNSFIVAAAQSGDTAGQELGLPILIELWSLSYNPENRRLKTSIMKSMRVEPSDGPDNAPDTGTVPKL